MSDEKCSKRDENRSFKHTSIDEQHVNKIDEFVIDLVGISEGSLKTILKDHLAL